MFPIKSYLLLVWLSYTVPTKSSKNSFRSLGFHWILVAWTTLVNFHPIWKCPLDIFWGSARKILLRQHPRITSTSRFQRNPGLQSALLSHSRHSSTPLQFLSSGPQISSFLTSLFGRKVDAVSGTWGVDRYKKVDNAIFFASCFFFWRNQLFAFYWS